VSSRAGTCPVTRQPLVPQARRARPTMTFFGRLTAMRRECDRHLGTARLRRGYPPGPLLRAQQFYSQHAGCDPACAGRQLRELHANAGRLRVYASGARRRPADRRGSRVEAPAKDAGASLYAARRHNACSAHDRGDRRTIAKTPGTCGQPSISAKRCSGWRSRSPDAPCFVRDEPPWSNIARFRHGIWRAPGAAASARPDAATGLGRAAGFFPRPLRKRWTSFVAMLMAGTPRRRQERTRAPCDLFDLMVPRAIPRPAMPSPDQPRDQVAP